MPRPSFSLIAFFVLAGTAWPISLIAGEISIAPDDEGHSVAIDGKTAIVEVTSRSGIGRATLRSTDGTWPDRLILRLHLGGLEHFEIGNGEMSLATSVGSSTPPVVHPTHVSPGAGPARQEVENQVSPKHPLYLHVRPVPSPEKKRGIPLQGYFEIEVPQDLLKSKPAELPFRWIDFYR